MLGKYEKLEMWKIGLNDLWILFLWPIMDALTLVITIYL